MTSVRSHSESKSSEADIRWRNTQVLAYLVLLILVLAAHL